ncbi:peptidase u61 ld-carboxypeptidase a [Apodospora peruviana]|uniref:Peptidase u61 ld-carboxypeptidase a n=1 Tax=Apodospora peruviana TaxID=516989 RepID=A0AAE0IPN0_9PEZI|nr:peptidase u61 ld-carboxypeptidase a [Apodospora peruviana]
MPSPITPPALKQGDTIAFISPSARLNDTLHLVMSRATDVLTKRGYKVRTFFTKDTGIQSSIRNRLSEIRSAFFDPTVSAIIATIGGTTFTELLPHLIADTDLHAHMRANPKIFVGYSDITGFHWFLHALTGLRTFYGPGAIPELGLPSSSTEDPDSALSFCVENMFKILSTPGKPFGEIPRSLQYHEGNHEFYDHPSSTKLPPLLPSPKWTWLRQGKATGRLFGGCLTVAARLGGVQAIRPDWRDKIVFMETATGDDEMGPPIDRVRAGFADLIAQGVFDHAAGLVIGRAYGYDTDAKRKRYADVIMGLFCDEERGVGKFPILFNVDFGHTAPMVTLPYDVLAKMDSERDRFAVVEGAVV